MERGFTVLFLIFKLSDLTVQLTSYLWTPTINRKWPAGVEAFVSSSAAAWIRTFPEDYPTDGDTKAIYEKVELETDKDSLMVEVF